MRKEIPLSVPNLKSDIISNLEECIESGWVSTGGRFISELESKIADYVQVPEAVSTQSGTAGLHLALKVLGVQPGDEVIVPTLTFVAAVNPISYLGAYPVFMDCNEFFCIDTEKLEDFLHNECNSVDGMLYNRKTGRKVAAIIPVHVFGNLCDMERIMALSTRYNLKVLEDATEALGSYYTSGKYKGKYAGTIGDMGVYSFNANKIITTGGGGMVVSNHKSYLDHTRYLGIQAKDDTLYFVHNEVGYNYRMLNIQAAMGVSQIDQLEEFIRVKIRNFELYSKLLHDVNGLKMLPFSAGRVNHWFYALAVDKEIFGCSRNELMHGLIEKGIQCRPVWKLIHTLKPYEKCQGYKISRAMEFEEGVLNIPCSTNITEEDVRYVVKEIEQFKR
ncbi:LegC family aminotransferase [Bacilliculturomica massiliensis]|uniref:LegC family aminotransferase n=1 Tax=Bacilliculturomica massiliensis TaxID=1917867 RepID=UPI001030E1D4|nr:LegC family aminotransferase [Bacilliculturomica massiliensis]